MTTRVTLHSLPDGQVVVEKVSLAGDLGDRQAEARWLALARDPGVVRLISATEDPCTITTAHAGATTLRTDHPVPEVAGLVLASLCGTLAGLHERSMAHGKLSLDHVILSAEGEAVLCSPDGNVCDPRADLAALGQMIGELIARWHARSEEIPSEAQWLSLADRLSAVDTTLTARRAAKAFARLGPHQPSSPAPSPTSRRPHLSGRALGLAISLVTVCGALVLAIASGSPRPPMGAVEVSVDQSLFAVGRAGDVVLALPEPCDAQPKVVLLDRDSVVWTFASAKDGASALPLVQVPGATDLSIRSVDGCSQVWASGPAGQTLVLGS